MPHNFSIIEHERYFVLPVVVYFLAIKIKKCQNTIKFKKIDLFYTSNGEYFFPVTLTQRMKV